MPELTWGMGTGWVLLLLLWFCSLALTSFIEWRNKSDRARKQQSLIVKFEQVFDRKYVDENCGLARLHLVAKVDQDLHVAAVAAWCAFEREEDSRYPTDSMDHRALQATSVQMKSEFWRKFNAVSPMDMPLRWRCKGGSRIFLASGSRMSYVSSTDGRPQEYDTMIKLYVIDLSTEEYDILRGCIARGIPDKEYVASDCNPLHEPAASPADKVHV